VTQVPTFKATSCAMALALLHHSKPADSASILFVLMSMRCEVVIVACFSNVSFSCDHVVPKIKIHLNVTARDA